MHDADFQILWLEEGLETKRKPNNQQLQKLKSFHHTALGKVMVKFRDSFCLRRRSKVSTNSAAKVAASDVTMTTQIPAKLDKTFQKPQPCYKLARHVSTQSQSNMSIHTYAKTYIYQETSGRSESRSASSRSGSTAVFDGSEGSSCTAWAPRSSAATPGPPAAPTVDHWSQPKKTLETSVLLCLLVFYCRCESKI